jgi:hypothetical protein
MLTFGCFLKSWLGNIVGQELEPQPEQHQIVTPSRSRINMLRLCSTGLRVVLLYCIYSRVGNKKPTQKTRPIKPKKNRLKKPKKTTSKRVLLGFFEPTYIFGTKITIFHVISLLRVLIWIVTKVGTQNLY